MNATFLTISKMIWSNIEYLRFNRHFVLVPYVSNHSVDKTILANRQIYFHHRSYELCIKTVKKTSHSHDICPYKCLFTQKQNALFSAALYFKLKTRITIFPSPYHFCLVNNTFCYFSCFVVCLITYTKTMIMIIYYL